jgi:hypothetical protein
MRISQYQTDSDIKPLFESKPGRAPAALSPVCEPIGCPNNPKHQIGQDQLFSETALEAGTNY